MRVFEESGQNYIIMTISPFRESKETGNKLKVPFRNFYGSKITRQSKILLLKSCASLEVDIDLYEYIRRGCV
jgi:hypothetical protein